MLKRNEYTHREAWLHAAIACLDREFFDGNGYKLPEKRACSCGFPKGGRGHTIGQCWAPETSKDGTINMFICPTQDEPIRVLDILLHELIHAQVGTAAGHKGPFKKLMKEFGLVGKATATYAEEGSELWLKLSRIATELGPYPHKAMVPPPKKTGRGSMGGWIRLKSTEDEEYKVLCSPKMIDEHGWPRDPWGQQMVPVNSEDADKLERPVRDGADFDEPEEEDEE